MRCWIIFDFIVTFFCHFSSEPNGLILIALQVWDQILSTAVVYLITATRDLKCRFLSPIACSDLGPLINNDETNCSQPLRCWRYTSNVVRQASCFSSWWILLIPYQNTVVQLATSNSLLNKIADFGCKNFLLSNLQVTELFFNFRRGIVRKVVCSWIQSIQLQYCRRLYNSL